MAKRAIEVVSDYRDTLPVQVGEIILQQDFLVANSERYLIMSAHGHNTLNILKRHRFHFLPPELRIPFPCVASVSGLLANDGKLCFTIYGEKYRDIVEPLIQRVERSLKVVCTEQIEPGKQFEQTVRIVGG